MSEQDDDAAILEDLLSTGKYTPEQATMTLHEIKGDANRGIPGADLQMNPGKAAVKALAPLAAVSIGGPLLGPIEAGAAGTLGRAMTSAGLFGAGSVAADLSQGQRPDFWGTLKGMLAVGSAQHLGELAPAIAARSGAAAAGISPKALRETRSAPLMKRALPLGRQVQLMSNPSEGAEMNAGRDLLSRTDASLASLPQLQKTTPPEQLSSIANSGARLSTQASRQTATAGTRASKTKAVADMAAAKVSRANDLAGIGNAIESDLHARERTLTEPRGEKIAMLQDATKNGVTIDAAPLLEKVRDMRATLAGSHMADDVAADTSLSRLEDTLTTRYGKDKSSALRPLSPVEADQVMQQIQNAHRASYGAINQPRSQQAMGALSKFWRGHVYDRLSGLSEKSAEIAKRLTAQETLRDQMTGSPSSFASRMAGTGPGSREARAALDAYEQAHGTGGAFGRGVDQLVTNNKQAVESIAARHQARVDVIQKKAASDIDAIQRQRDTEMSRVRIARDIAQGNQEAAFNAQASTPQQQARFKAANTLKQYISDKSPERFVESLWSGDASSQSALDALRQFEKEQGTNGAIESTLRDLNIRRQWNAPRRAEAGRLVYWLERGFAGRAAKLGTILQRPLGYGAAAAISAFAGAMQQPTQMEKTIEQLKRPNP